MKAVAYLSNLTPLRGIAALLTVIFHVDVMLGNGGNYLVHFQDSTFLTRMYTMVDFFFILSGFIMCHVYGKLFSGAVSREAFKKFTIARFARVYPLHFLTLSYTVVLFFVAAKLGIPEVPVLQIANSWYSIGTNLTLLHSMNLHNWFSWDHASWSISTEWWAYMVFPFLVGPFMRLNSIGRVVVASLCFAGYMCITFLIVPIVTVPVEIPFVKVNPADLSLNVSYQYGYLRCLFGFILGMMMYQGFQADWGRKILGNGYVLAILAVLPFISMHMSLPDIVTVGFFPFILLSGAYGSKGIDAFFGNKALQRLGDWSFSIYLVHQPLLFTIGSIKSYLNPPDPASISAGPPPNPGLLTAWMICLGVIALTLFLSFLTYRYWEVPARRWIASKAA